jgi:hypothetical protein
VKIAIIKLLYKPETSQKIYYEQLRNMGFGFTLAALLHSVSGVVDLTPKDHAVELQLHDTLELPALDVFINRYCWATGATKFFVNHSRVQQGFR